MKRLLPTATLVLAACSAPPTATPDAGVRSVTTLAHAPTIQEPPAQPTIPPEPTGSLEPADPLALEHAHRPGEDHVRRGRELRADGELHEAVDEARRAIADDRYDEDALTLLARAGEVSGERALAAEAQGRLGALRPDDPAPMVRRARLLLSLRRLDEALAAGAEAVGRDPEGVGGYQVLGRIHLTAGELEPAMEMFEKVISLEPEHGHALNNLGLAYLRANLDEEAVEVLTRAAGLLPDLAYVHNNLGVALERTGDRAGANTAYARARALSPRYVNARLNARRIADASRLEVDLLDDPSPSDGLEPMNAHGFSPRPSPAAGEDR